MNSTKRLASLLLFRSALPGFALLLAIAPLLARADTAELTVHNRSKYKMYFEMWKNGKSCTDKLAAADSNLNPSTTQTLAVPTENLIAAAIAIFDVGDQAPVACDYILSFKLNPGGKYTLEYDIHDRRCYGQLYENADGTSKLILPGDAAELHERISILGWDMSEPGCEE